MKRLFFISLIISLLLASCSVSKKAAQQSITTATTVDTATVVAKPDSFAAAAALIQSTTAAQPTFNTLNMSKFDLGIQFGTLHYTLRGSMRIVRDSIVTISLQPMLGIEVIRIDFRKDNFTIYDKMNHRYCETPYDAIHIATGIPVDYRIIQSVVSAQFFSIPHIDDKSFIKADSTDSTYTIVGCDELNSMYQYFEIYSKYPLLAHAGMKQGSAKSTPNSIANTANAPFMVSYGDYSVVNRKNKDQLFPYLINIEIDHRLFFFNARVNVEKVTYNEEIVVTKINTEKYTRVPFSQIFAIGK